MKAERFLYILMLFCLNTLVFSHFLTRVRQHKFYTVELIDARSSRVVINGDDIDVGLFFLDRTDHSLTAYVVGQTAKGLCADNVFDADVVQLQHFGGEKPAFAHFGAATDVAFGKRDGVTDRRGRNKAAVLADRADNVRLLPFEKTKGKIG